MSQTAFSFAIASASVNWAEDSAALLVLVEGAESRFVGGAAHAATTIRIDTNPRIFFIF
jgi:hypothetical protein